MEGKRSGGWEKRNKKEEEKWGKYRPHLDGM